MLGSLNAIPKGVRIWEAVFESAKDKGHPEDSSAAQAWGAVKQAGFYQDDTGEWHEPGNHPGPDETLVNVGADEGKTLGLPLIIGGAAGLLVAWIAYATLND